MEQQPHEPPVDAGAGPTDTGGPAAGAEPRPDWPGAPGSTEAGAGPAGPAAASEVSPDAMLEQLSALGISREMVKASLAPIVGELLTAQTERIMQLVDQRITHSVDQIAGKIAEQLQGNPVAAAAAGNAGGGNNQMGNAFFTMLMNKMAGGAGAPPAGADPAAPVMAWANTMSDLWGKVLQPMLGVYSSGRSDMLSQLSTLARMGESMPWDGGKPPEGGPTPTPAPTPAPTAAAHQPKRSTAADVAGKIRLTSAA